MSELSRRLFRGVASGGPAVTDIREAPAGLTNQTVDQVVVEFSDPIDPTTFGPQDISLRRDGGDDLITPDVNVTQQTATVFAVSNLGDLTDAPGDYVLTIDATGVRDTDGARGVGSETIAWQLDTTTPDVAEITGTTADIVSQPVDRLVIAFSEEVDFATVSRDDLGLTRNDGDNLLDDSTAVAQVSPTVYELTGLVNLTAEDGVYVLTVDTVGITDCGKKTVQRRDQLVTIDYGQSADNDDCSVQCRPEEPNSTQPPGK